VRCANCGRPLVEVHGHLTCYVRGCLLYGQPQHNCCEGERAQPPPAHLMADRARRREETA
jgi:hypothetical protein